MARSGWKRGQRKGNYTDMQRNIACRIKNGFAEEPCSYVKQAAISLGYEPSGQCPTGVSRPGGSVCRAVGKGSPVGAFGRAHS